MKILLLLISFSITIVAQPSYKIWSVIASQNINKGDTVVFDLGLSGNGDINPNLLKFNLYSDTTAKIFIKGFISPSEILNLSFNTNINFLFKNMNSVILPTDSTRITIEPHFLTVPISSGDKTIKVIATYSSDSSFWHTEEAYINFHVNTWYEEYETLLVVIGLLLAFMALLDPISNVFIKVFKKESSQKLKSKNIVQKKQK